MARDVLRQSTRSVTVYCGERGTSRNDLVEEMDAGVLGADEGGEWFGMESWSGWEWHARRSGERVGRSWWREWLCDGTVDGC